MNAKTVNIYSCGPTVYNYAHIGNLSSYIYADILRRAVKLSGYEVHHVMNLTDVDDKTIRDSHLEFPDDEPMTALEKLTTKYSQIFIDEMREIGNEIGADLDANETFCDGFNLTRATNNIDGIQNLVRKLLCEKIAYVANDGIYFSIAEYQKTRKYGQLSEISVGNSRINNDEYSKENAQDFALWKRQKPGEPAWNFDFSDLDTFEILWSKERQIRDDFSKVMLGRPGWHI
jgi:cysteinyl-tRNA synthetase